MAILGTIVLEDTIIHFEVLGDSTTTRVKYTVADGRTGESERKAVDARAFMTALGIALDFEGDENATVAEYRQAESVQPDNKNLRFIP